MEGEKQPCMLLSLGIRHRGLQDQLVESAKQGGTPSAAGLAGLAMERTRYT